MVGSKQPQPVYLSVEETDKHCQAGPSVWKFASTDEGLEPDVVLVCIGSERVNLRAKLLNSSTTIWGLATLSTARVQRCTQGIKTLLASSNRSTRVTAVHRYIES